MADGSSRIHAGLDQLQSNYHHVHSADIGNRLVSELLLNDPRNLFRLKTVAATRKKLICAAFMITSVVGIIPFYG